jgi:hypothetical protein
MLNTQSLSCSRFDYSRTSPIEFAHSYKQQKSQIMTGEHNSQTKAIHFIWNATLFSIIGPPIGAVSLLAVLLVFYPSFNPPNLAAAPLFAIVGMGYVLGAFPAFITGILVSWRGAWGSVSIPFTLASATIAVAIPMLAYALIAPSSEIHILLLGAILIGSYPAALACLFIARYVGWVSCRTKNIRY